MCNSTGASGSVRSASDPVAVIVADAKPLTARSVVASTLLGVDPPRLPARLLVRSGELFGISQGTTRTAISRMCAGGELSAADGFYELAGPAFTARAGRQAISRSGQRRAWDGTWTMAVVVHGMRDAAMRAELRQAAIALRLGERREGVWLRPDNLPAAHDAAVSGARVVADAQCEWFAVQPVDDPAALAAGIFDLQGWPRRAIELRAALAALTARLEAGDIDVLGDAFVVSAAALRHLQADPLLPDVLTGSAWPGASLRDIYERFDAAFKAAWSAWFATQH